MVGGKPDNLVAEGKRNLGGHSSVGTGQEVAPAAIVPEAAGDTRFQGTLVPICVMKQRPGVRDGYGGRWKGALRRMRRHTLVDGGPSTGKSHTPRFLSSSAGRQAHNTVRSASFSCLRPRRLKDAYVSAPSIKRSIQ